MGHGWWKVCNESKLSHEERRRKKGKESLGKLVIDKGGRVVRWPTLHPAAIYDIRPSFLKSSL